MIYRCPNCGNVLVYDTKSGLLCCDSCGSVFNVMEAIPSEEESTVFQENTEASQNSLEEQADLVDDRYMEMKIYHCTSCGADIMVSDTEVSTICTFCGLPSIIFERISHEEKPLKILPFKISKSEALANIKARFQNNKYVVDEVKDISVDKIYGIYIPYWIYRGAIDRAFTTKFYRYNRKTAEDINLSSKEELSVMLDASKNLPDDLSMRLEPFPLCELVNFNTAYLSGFYAEKYDVKPEARQEEAHKSIKKIVDDKLLVTFLKSQNIDPKELINNRVSYSWDTEEYKLKLVQSALVPIYFVTIRQQHRVMLVLVNGSTGKVVTNVPLSQEKIKKSYVRNAIIPAIAYAFIFICCCSFTPDFYGLWMLAIIPIVVLITTITNGIKAKEHYNQSGRGVREARVNMMSRERGAR